MMGRQVEQAALFYEFSLERHGARLKREYGAERVILLKQMDRAVRRSVAAHSPTRGSRSP